MNIYEEIRKDHEKQRTLLKVLSSTNGASEDREELWKRLKRELELHADAEERYFYKPLFGSDKAQDKARHSVAEHHEIDELIEKVEETDMSSPGWLAHLKNLKDKVIHHLDEEEYEVFQLSGKVLTEEEKKNLAEEYRNMMQDSKEERKVSV